MEFPPDCAIELIIKSIVALAAPDMIYFFGSRARGDHDPDSDLDLLIVIPDPVDDRRQLQNEMRQVLVGHRPIVEPWIMGRLEFEETKDVVGGLAYPATHDGYVIYAKC